MNVTRLRAIMNRYREAGVLLVGAYLVGHHLWTKRRIILLMTPATLLVLACWLAGVLKGPDLAAKPTLPPTPNVVSSVELQSPIYRPQQPLLPRATQVTALDEHYLTHFWISANRLLLVTSAQPTDSYDSVDVEPSEWRGQATLLDVRAGHRHKLAGLTRLFHKMHAMPESFETSPGGTWLKWMNRETGDGWSRPVVARWDGSEYQQWDKGRDSSTYWLDDHRWVDEERTNYGASDVRNDIFVYDAEQKTMVDLESHSKAGQKLVRTHYDSCEHPFKTSWEPEKPLGPRVTIAEEKDSDAVTDAVVPLHTCTVRMPAGAEVRQIVVSPKTRRVLYILYFRQVAEAIRPQPKSGVFDIWTSRLGGNDMKELGYLETGDFEDFGDMDPLSSQNMTDIEWLPNGKQFSFIYRKKLYRAAGY